MQLGHEAVLVIRGEAAIDDPVGGAGAAGGAGGGGQSGGGGGSCGGGFGHCALGAGHGAAERPSLGGLRGTLELSSIYHVQ